MAETHAGEKVMKHQEAFSAVVQGPLHMRYDVLGSKSAARICDGEWFWSFPVAPNAYTKSRATAENCKPPFGRWRDLTNHLIDAEITGHGQSEFQGHPQACEIVKASYGPSVPPAQTVTRTFCIDPQRDLVLREGLYRVTQPGSPGAGSFSMETTYSSVELNPSLGAEFFRFDPPPGSKEAATASQTSTVPVLLKKREAKYTKEAIKAKLEGTVVVILVVGTDGVPGDVKVLRGLGMGLDERAIEAVKQWRFRPATKDGQPVAMVAQIAVNFRLLHRGRPSSQ